MIVFMLRVSSEVIAAMDQGGPAAAGPAVPKIKRQAAPLDSSIMRAVYEYAWKRMEPREYAKTESSTAWTKSIDKIGELNNEPNRIIFEGALTACMRVPSMLLCCTEENAHLMMLKVFLRNHSEHDGHVRYFSKSDRKKTIDQKNIQSCVRRLLTSMVEDDPDSVYLDQVRYGNVPAQRIGMTISEPDAARGEFMELDLYEDDGGDGPKQVNELQAPKRKVRDLPVFANIVNVDTAIDVNTTAADLSNVVLNYLKCRFNDRVAKILHCILARTNDDLVPHIVPLIRPLIQKVICKISENMPTEHTPTHFDLTYYDSDEEVLCRNAVMCIRSSLMPCKLILCVCVYVLTGR
jgi:hypothetical protein